MLAVVPAPTLDRTAPILLALALSGLAGCAQAPSGRTDTGGGGDAALDSGRDSGPLSDTGPPCVGALPIDLLFVVDNSNSMREEQLNLADNFAELLDVLTSPPDLDRDGEPDFPPAEDVRVGIVSTDLGTAPHVVSSCNTMGGDRGVLVTSPRGGDARCADVSLPTSAPWLSYTAGDDAAELGRRFSCLARLGTMGCGIEQQLEAMHQALVAQSAPGMPNEGFLRNDSLLAVVFVTDEDDCSAADTDVFDPGRNADLGPYGVRCAQHPELLHPIERYVTALDGLRAGPRNPIVVGAITGVPPIPGNPLLTDLGALLMDPRMQYVEDMARPGQLVPACDRPGSGSAVPARRVVELARRFAMRGGGLATSICDDSYSPAMQALGTLIGARLCGPVE